MTDAKWMQQSLHLKTGLRWTGQGMVQFEAIRPRHRVDADRGEGGLPWAIGLLPTLRPPVDLESAAVHADGVTVVGED